MQNRKITVYYEDEQWIERELVVEVEQQDRFAAIVIDDLDHIPEREHDRIKQQAEQKFWELEHEAWLLTPEAEAMGH